MIFEYSPKKVYTSAIAVDDIGNTCLRCTTEDMLDFFIATKTEFGKTKILNFGPVAVDVKDENISTFSLAVSTIDYNEKKIVKAIKGATQNPKINLITEITADEMLDLIPDKEYLF